MNIYLLSQSEVDGYDTYDSCVVAAENEEDARQIHPSEFVTHVKDGKFMGTYSDTALNGKAGKEYENDNGYEWVSYRDINLIEVKLIGVADEGIKRGVICASFNAG